MADHLAVLKNEFEAGEGSFLIRPGSEPSWDREGFTRLTPAARECCEASAGYGTLERWIAEGFWHVPTFVRGWTWHENVPRPYHFGDYQDAYERLEDLAYRHLTGESPNQDGMGFGSM